ncbi:predicted protein [Aspergillus terreus NIH2624]|uniref:Myb-like domain-containing protein n=1 Tax=Aspergillus terreus (strain NIH 2624 / FGSC A1156) TaxID=341663 RepID=Q0CC68_ASPTN|nr:uncharacterized protein ATEG_08716 [Aspergillus terreus NIH2624]EAU30848.1 predicted protein [Aspergillus terreus NIH2624]
MRKRPRDDSDDFERYERAVDVRRRRAEKPDQSRHKRLRRDEPDTDSDSPARQLRNGMATAGPTTQPSPRRSTPRVEVPPPSTASSIITTTDRKRWLPQEDNRLIRMMRLFGVKWAKIEKENEIQPLMPDELSIEDRNQVQLKDRARNLKMKFYREGQPLPPNFDKVTMGKKYYDQLRRLGINVPDHHNRQDTYKRALRHDQAPRRTGRARRWTRRTRGGTRRPCRHNRRRNSGSHSRSRRRRDRGPHTSSSSLRLGRGWLRLLGRRQNRIRNRRRLVPVDGAGTPGRQRDAGLHDGGVDAERGEGVRVRAVRVCIRGSDDDRLGGGIDAAAQAGGEDCPGNWAAACRESVSLCVWMGARGE